MKYRGILGSVLACWLLVGFLLTFISHGLHFSFTLGFLVKIIFWPFFLAIFAFKWILVWVIVLVICFLCCRILYGILSR